MWDLHQFDLKNTLVISALKEECPEAHYFSGIGKIRATIKTMQMIQQERPQRIINLGSCASIEHPIGSIVTVKWAVNDDFYMPGIAKETLHLEPIDGYEPTTCFTADQFRSPTNVGIIDMECYAIAHVCQLYGVEFQALKKVSDSGSFDDWCKNKQN